jgi:hypothetical protein
MRKYMLHNHSASLIPHHKDHVYKLHKALHGLKQAPWAWYDHLKKFLLEE